MLILLLSAILLIGSLPNVTCAQSPQKDTTWAHQDVRNEMVRMQIAQRGITDEAVLRAMRQVPRHAFVPDVPHELAYTDRPLPIGHNQTISQPFIVAYMTEAVRPDATDRVLEVGTGSGYQAAVLAAIVDSVYTVEIIPELADEARNRLRRLGYRNVQVRTGDGYEGWRAHAPFDIIVVTAAPERIPPPLLDQLKPGGRMVIPVGPTDGTQQLLLVTKENGEVLTEELTPVRFVPFLREH